MTAFSFSASKTDEACGFGAHHVVNSRDDAELAAVAGSLDFLLVTVNVSLNWPLYLNALKRKGTLHIVGAVPEPLPVSAFDLLAQQKRVTVTPLGRPRTMALMLDFCSRHGIKPQIEIFPRSRVNEAMARVEAGQARYRVVLESDFDR